MSTSPTCQTQARLPILPLPLHPILVSAVPSSHSRAKPEPWTEVEHGIVLYCFCWNNLVWLLCTNPVLCLTEVLPPSAVSPWLTSGGGRWIDTAMSRSRSGAGRAGLWGCGGGLERGALMRAGSLPPPARCCAALEGGSQWDARASVRLGSRIAPEVPCFQSEACNFSIAAFFFFPSLPLLSSHLSCLILLFWGITSVLLSLSLSLKWYLLHFSRPQSDCPRCSAWREICHLLVIRDYSRWGRSCSWRQTWALKTCALPSPLCELKIALKWGHQPFRVHGISSSCVCQHKCCIMIWGCPCRRDVDKVERA